MNSILYVVGYCRSCGTGPLGIRRCGHCDELCVLCDECDALWPSPDLQEKPTFPEQPELPCGNCGKSLLESPSRWARFADIEAVGWQASVIDVSRAFGNHCTGNPEAT